MHALPTDDSARHSSHKADQQRATPSCLRDGYSGNSGPQSAGGGTGRHSIRWQTSGASSHTWRGEHPLTPPPGLAPRHMGCGGKHRRREESKDGGIPHPALDTWSSLRPPLSTTSKTSPSSTTSLQTSALRVQGKSEGWTPPAARKDNATSTTLASPTSSLSTSSAQGSGSRTWWQPPSTGRSGRPGWQAPRRGCALSRSRGPGV